MPRKSALRVSPKPDEPNLILPLASSYNERGVLGYTHTVTNSEDQRKLNCFYELVKNSATGKGTLSLTKRPGVVLETGVGVTSVGTSTQDVYLIVREAKATKFTPWIANKNGNDIRVSSGSVDTTLFSSASAITPAYVDVTNISGVETVVLQTQLGGGSFGSQRAFYASDIATWTEITDADFTALSHRGKIEHLDGYAFILADTNRIWNSDVNSLANWGASSFITKQITQDLPIGLAKLNKQIIAFGFNTMEPFYNPGTTTTGSPLIPIGHLQQRVGLAAPLATATAAGGHYYCVIGSKAYFVGRREGGESSIGFFVYDGSNAIKISPTYIDKILLEKYSTGVNLNASNGFSSVNSFDVHGKTAVAIALTQPNDTTQRWLMYFPDWNEWFEWSSTVFGPINMGQYFLPCSANNKDRVYKFTASDNWQDNEISYQWFTQFRLPSPGSSRRFLLMYGVDADTDTTANNLTAEISTDDCATFSTLGTIDQTQDRKVLFRGGSFRKAFIRLGNTNARPSRLHNFLARVE